MAVLSTRSVAVAGSTPAPVAASAGGDRVECGPTNFLRVTCGATGATVTVDSVVPCSFGFDHDLSVVVPANQSREIGPLPAARFASLSDGLAAVTYSQVATVTVEAVKV